MPPQFDSLSAETTRVSLTIGGNDIGFSDIALDCINYAAIFPETGFGCWPQMPIGFGDVPYLRAKQKELNAMLATQAAANGRHAGRLVQSQHRSRRLQGLIDPLGRAGCAEQSGSTDPSQSGRDDGRGRCAWAGR